RRLACSPRTDRSLSTYGTSSSAVSRRRRRPPSCCHSTCLPLKGSPRKRRRRTSIPCKASTKSRLRSDIRSQRHWPAESAVSGRTPDCPGYSQEGEPPRDAINQVLVILEANHQKGREVHLDGRDEEPRSE